MVMNKLHNTTWGFISKDEYNYIKSLKDIEMSFHPCITINIDTTENNKSKRWQIWLEQTQKKELVKGIKIEEIDACYKERILNYCKNNIANKY